MNEPRPTNQYRPANDRDDQFLLELKRRLSEQGRELARMVEEFESMAEDLDRREKHLRHLEALITDLGERVPSREPMTPYWQYIQTGIRSRRMHGGQQRLITEPAEIAEEQTDAPSAYRPGNRTDKSPKRRPEFANSSLTDAALAFMNEGLEVTVEMLAARIYFMDEATKDQEKVARANLRSVLASGVEKKKWLRIKPGAYALADKVEVIVS